MEDYDNLEFVPIDDYTTDSNLINLSIDQLNYIKSELETIKQNIVKEMNDNIIKNYNDIIVEFSGVQAYIIEESLSNKTRVSDIPLVQSLLFEILQIIILIDDLIDSEKNKVDIDQIYLEKKKEMEEADILEQRIRNSKNNIWEKPIKINEVKVKEEYDPYIFELYEKLMNIKNVLIDGYKSNISLQNLDKYVCDFKILRVIILNKQMSPNNRMKLHRLVRSIESIIGNYGILSD
jgi:hypothetical protein